MAARIRIKDDGQLAKFMALKGYENMNQLADAMGVNRSTVSRTFAGESDVGMVFLTRLLTAFPELDFNDLFVVVGQRRSRRRHADTEDGLPDGIPDEVPA